MAWKLVAAALFVAFISLGVYTFWPQSTPTEPWVQTNLSTNDANSASLTNSAGSTNSEQAGSGSSTSTATEKNTKFATMMAFQGGLGFSGNKSLEDLAWSGWSNLRSSSSWDTFYSQLTGNFSKNAKLAKQTGFSSNRDVVGSFAWNVIQPTEGGDYDWTMPDATMKYAGEAGVSISAVLYPYGSWQTSEVIETSKCAGIDFAFFDSHYGYPKDMEAYKKFVTAVVERYDGDGVDDMPDLASRVEDYEVGNEIEGICTSSSADDYLNFLKSTYDIIKAADANVLVANAGALEIIGQTGRIQTTIDFWQDFFALGGAEFVDVFTVHYNAERAEVKSTPDDFQENVAFFRDLLDNNNAQATPIWLTEFGLPTSAAYKTYVGVGDELEVERYFIDLTGGNKGLGVSALFEGSGKARDFLTTLQGL